MCSAPGMCSRQTKVINLADKKVEFKRGETVAGSCLCSGRLQDIEEVKLCQERKLLDNGVVMTDKHLQALGE